MEQEDLRRFQSIERCDRFLREQEWTDVGIRTAAQGLHKVREELVVLIRKEAYAKVLRPNDGREIRKRAHYLRKRVLARIARAAKTVDGFLEHTPGARKALKVPHPSESADSHVEAGRRFARFLKDQRASFFKDAGIPKEITAELRAATEALRKQAALVNATLHERTRVLRDIKARARKGRAQIDLLSLLLEPVIADSELEVEWNFARRVGRKTGRPRYTAAERAEAAIQAAARRAERREERKREKIQRAEARRAQRLARASSP